MHGAARTSVLLLTAWVSAACGTDADGPVPSGKFEMYLNEDGLTQLELTFLRGRCCAQLTLDAKSTEARQALIAFAEQVAAAIPLDGSAPTTDAALTALVPASGSFADWQEDLSIDPFVGPRLISTTAADWANGGVGPFDEHGFEAVALEEYERVVEGWHLSLALLYQSSAAGADAAFHYRNPGFPDDPYWDYGTRLH